MLIKNKDQIIMKKTSDMDKHFKDDLVFAKRTEEALKRYEKGLCKEMSFKEFSKGERGTMIVSFLALLELVKQGIIKAEQQGDDIHMEKDAVSTPTYGH